MEWDRLSGTGVATDQKIVQILNLKKWSGAAPSSGMALFHMQA